MALERMEMEFRKRCYFYVFGIEYDHKQMSISSETHLERIVGGV